MLSKTRGSNDIERLTDKWYLVVTEYEKVKAKKSDCFKKVEQICGAYQVQRKDFKKNYLRWVNGGRKREALLPKKTWRLTIHNSA